MEETIDKTPTSIARDIGSILSGFENEVIKKKHKPAYGKKGITASPFKTEKNRKKEKARRKMNKKCRSSKK
jgi:hypothetical protein